MLEQSSFRTWWRNWHTRSHTLRWRHVRESIALIQGIFNKLSLDYLSLLRKCKRGGGGGQIKEDKEVKLDLKPPTNFTECASNGCRLQPFDSQWAQKLCFKDFTKQPLCRCVLWIKTTSGIMKLSADTLFNINQPPQCVVSDPHHHQYTHWTLRGRKENGGWFSSMQ